MRDAGRTTSWSVTISLRESAVNPLTSAPPIIAA